MKKVEKFELVKKLTEALKASKSSVLIDFAGMNIKAQQNLKKKLKEADSQVFVVKNTLLQKAAKEAGFPETALDNSIYTGQTAVVMTTADPISPISALGKFAKDSEYPKMKIGVVDGIFQDNATLLKLSLLPSKDQLQANLIGVIASPLYSIVTTLNSKMQELIFILNSKASV